MDKIGIIAGKGLLPLLIGKSLIKNKYQICFFYIDNYENNNSYLDYENEKIELKSFSKIITSLKNHNINKIVMAGKIIRPSVKDIEFDFNTLSLIKDYLLESKGDDNLLKSISNLFAKKGFPLFNWRNICVDLFSSKDYLTKKRPSKLAISNKNKGLAIFKIIGKSDVGQSIIVQNHLILGIECSEGTDELIIRCNNYKKKGDKGILLKLSKYNQSSILDLPTIGINTLNNLNKYNYEGIFIEKNSTIIIDKDKIIKFCDENDLFLSTVDKID